MKIPNKKSRLRRIEKQFIQSWWLILFIICCYVFYERGISRHADDFNKLQRQYSHLQKEKAFVSVHRENLMLQINSQSDPEWVEMTLINGLGLVKEDQVKVLFTDEEELLKSFGN